MTNFILDILIAYFLGAIPFAIMVVKVLKGVDVRHYGSKNAGATNVYRVAGIKAALLVGILDLGKGFVSVYFLPQILPPPATIPILQLQIICAVAVILGHMFTVFAGFKGGKGVLAGAGAFLALMPAAVGIAFGFFIIIVVLTRFISLGSICAALSIPVILFIEKYALGKYIPDELLILSIIIAIAVVFAHRSNIARLFAGTENKIGKRPRNE
jgi:glycerol-3-phosphate acyltransferase PlsY